MSKYVRQEKSQRKHPVISSSTSIIKAPVIAAHIKERPDWKGPGFIKKAPKQPARSVPSTSSAAPNIQQNLLPFELQQLLLNIFRTTFPACQEYETLKPTLQQINDALSERDFERAFGCLEWLEAYSVRWSPSRALCCANVLAELCEEFQEEYWVKMFHREEKGGPSKAVCFGGGATEIMAFGALLRHLQTDSGEPAERLTLTLKISLVDAANWAPVISSLYTALTTPPLLSKYASAKARENNAPLITSDLLHKSFRQSNILEISEDALRAMLGAEPSLLTLFFTLGDLYATSVAKTTAFLLKMTTVAPTNSLLLIIDRSEPPTAARDEQNEKKKYPIQYLLDMVLTEKDMPRTADSQPPWERLLGDKDRGFKLDERLKFPLGLENMGIQVHLFKKL